MGLRLHPLNSPDDEGFDAAVITYREDLEVRDPGDPPASTDYLAAEFFHSAPDRRRFTVAATVDGEPAGVGWASTTGEPDDETRAGEIDVVVRESQRGRGVATALVADLVPRLAAVDQNSIIAYPCADLYASEAKALCAKFGLEPRQEERCSRALVADIDDDLLQGWIDDATTKAAGYRLASWEGEIGDEYLDAWCEAEAAMEDMPLDDLDFTLHTRQGDARRAADAVTVASGFAIYRALALTDDGVPAGMSEIFLHRSRPEVAHQGNTGVLADHRGHGLGRWLKAANYRVVADAHPELAVVETYNAQSNPWMLDINIAMGFKPHHVYVAHQAPIETVLVRLSGG